MDLITKWFTDRGTPGRFYCGLIGSVPGIVSKSRTVRSSTTRGVVTDLSCSFRQEDWGLAVCFERLETSRVNDCRL